MTHVDPGARGAAKARSGAHRIALGAVAGTVLGPALAFASASIWNGFDPACSGGGAEDSLACTLRLVMLTLFSVPAGALAGILAGLSLGPLGTKRPAAPSKPARG